MAFQGDSIYWVEVEKVVPNPFQPRREFDEQKLKELSESIRMYGVLQPLTVTRNEIQRDDGTFYTEYELVAGERRLRASKLAGLSQVPVIIREGDNNEQEKLELAIIENLQREDLNAVDRALAFRQLAEVFGLSHALVAKKVGRSREYVSNSIRLLGLPDYMLSSLRLGEMSEGHARTLLMLNDRPEEQDVVFREILLKKLSVREVEKIVRKIATDKVRKKKDGDSDTELIEIEKRFMETLGTRVHIQKTDFGGKLTIDYFSVGDLEEILILMKSDQKVNNDKKDFDTLSAHTPLTILKEDEEVSSKFDESLSHPSQVDDKEKLVYGDFSMDEDLPVPVASNLSSVSNDNQNREQAFSSEQIGVGEKDKNNYSQNQDVQKIENENNVSNLTPSHINEGRENTFSPRSDLSENNVVSTDYEQSVPKIENHPVDLIAPVQREQIANHIPDGLLVGHIQPIEKENGVENKPIPNEEIRQQNSALEQNRSQFQPQNHSTFSKPQIYNYPQSKSFVKNEEPRVVSGVSFPQTQNNRPEFENERKDIGNYQSGTSVGQGNNHHQNPYHQNQILNEKTEQKHVDSQGQNHIAANQNGANSPVSQTNKQRPPIEQTAPTPPQKPPADDDSDMYSIRNFSV